jgi:hypothetical protein
MNKIKEEPTDLKQITQSFSICRYCQAKITAENELLPRIDYKETEILNLKQKLENMILELDHNETKL